MKILELDIDIKKFHIETTTAWIVKYNEFYQVHPAHKVLILNCPDHDYWELFKSTLVVIENQSQQLAIDVGWQPEADEKGAFVIRLLKDYDYSAPLKESQTREPNEVLSTLQQWMQENHD